MSGFMKDLGPRTAWLSQGLCVCSAIKECFSAKGLSENLGYWAMLLMLSLARLWGQLQMKELWRIKIKLDGEQNLEVTSQDRHFHYGYALNRGSIAFLLS